MLRSKEKNKAFRFFALYTVIFAFTCFVVFCWYFLKGRTFIWKDDGWMQHYKALVYYAECLRSIVRELVHHHRFVLPEWEFALGEGNDILHSLHYYVAGDPFTVFSVLVPTRFMWVYYDFMILLRLYLSGVAFSCLCFSTQKGIGEYAVIAGALSYAFCSWGIINANRHPFFLIPMLYFPLIILGIEKILQREKPYILIVSVFLAAISNFYYFYNIVLLTVVYVVVRLLTKYKMDLNSMRSVFIRICGSSVLGAAIGSVVLLPVIYAFLTDTRMGSPPIWYLNYSPTYYIELIWAFFYGTEGYWFHMGYAAPVILAIFLLFMRKGQHRLLKVCFFVCIMIASVPAFGQLLNGMSYQSNKWCWAFALLCAYIFSVMWSELMNLKGKEAWILAVLLGLLLVWDIVYLGLMRSARSKALAVAVCIGIAFAFLLVAYPFRLEILQKSLLWKRWKQAAALGLVIAGVGLVSAFRNAPFALDYAREGMYAKNVVNRLMQTEVNAVQEAATIDDTTDFYRYSGRSLTQNAGMLYRISSTNYFWTISNPAVGSFRFTMGFPEYRTFSYLGYDDRTALLTLSSAKYFVVPEKNKTPIPYGFTRVENLTSGYKVYRNEYVLPISYRYDFVISEEHWNSLSSVEKQEAMLKSVFLAGYDGETQDGSVEYDSRSLEYSLECNSDKVTLEDSRFVVTAPNSSVTFRFEGLADSETYFSINGLTVDGISTRAKLKLKSSSGVSKTIDYLTERHYRYDDRHDFTANLNYTEEPVTAITVTFSHAGVYSFDSIEVACHPMDSYVKQAAVLKNTGLENVVMETDTVSGTISLEKPQVLCFSIPYSAGWTAYVDGEKTVLYQANIKNMAVPLDAGTHDVRLVYRTPYLRMGACLSLAGSIGFFAMLWNDNKKRKISS